MDLQHDAEYINNCIFCGAYAWFMSVRRSETIHSAPVAWLSHHSLQGSPAVLSLGVTPFVQGVMASNP